jgi:hypothetical protein
MAALSTRLSRLKAYLSSPVALVVLAIALHLFVLFCFVAGAAADIAFRPKTTPARLLAHPELNIALLLLLSMGVIAFLHTSSKRQRTVGMLLVYALYAMAIASFIFFDPGLGCCYLLGAAQLARGLSNQRADE